MTNADREITNEAQRRQAAIKKEYTEARILANWAVASGRVSIDGQPVNPMVLKALDEAILDLESDSRESGENLRTILKSSDKTNSDSESDYKEPSENSESAWLRFQVAYGDLARWASPITATTLKATSDEFPTRASILNPFGRISEAKTWSRALLLLAVIFTALVIWAAYLERAYGAPPDTPQSADDIVRIVMELLVPFLYGGLGACAYLVKSVHHFIHERSFDPLRKPEYYSRILLGLIGGGTVTLFVDNIADNGADIAFSAAALGFIAGYNTDFVFAAVERIVAAILPKVGIDTVRRASVPAVDVKASDVISRLGQASDPDERKALLALLEKITARV